MTGNVRLGDIFKLKFDKDGKVKIERDEAAIKARKPVNKRYAKPKTRFAKPGEKSLSNAR